MAAVWPPEPPVVTCPLPPLVPGRLEGPRESPAPLAKFRDLPSIMVVYNALGRSGELEWCCHPRAVGESNRRERSGERAAMSDAAPGSGSYERHWIIQVRRGKCRYAVRSCGLATYSIEMQPSGITVEA